MQLDELNGEHRKQLQIALLKAFPKQEALEQMLSFRLEWKLNEIATNMDYSYVVFQLIERAVAEGDLRTLINAACTEKPRNLKLKPFCEQLRQEQATTKQSHRLMDPRKFDLSDLIRNCLNILDGKQGLVGLAVPYNQDPFLIYFCERLKERIGKNYTDSKQPLTLDHYRTSVDTAVKIIKRYKQLLQKGDVICPIRVAVSDPNSSEEFWQKISAEFKDNFEHRLIMILVSSECKFFPQGVIQLKPPQFTKADAHEWILDVTTILGWGELHRNKWKQYMIDECLEGEFLNIRLVYEHLEYTIKLLQQSYTAEAFLKELGV